jgi:hypothetical protein
MVEGDRDGDELASASTDDPAAPNSSSDHRPSGNVSGSAVHNRDPPNGNFFPKSQKAFFRYRARSIGRRHALETRGLYRLGGH